MKQDSTLPTRKTDRLWHYLSRHWPLSLIILLYLLLAVIYSVVVPLGESPDETEHFRYMQHIALTGELPVMVPVYEENVTIEAHQPPLLYLAGAGLVRGLGLYLDPAHNLPANACFSFDPDDPGRQHAYFHVPAEWPPARDLFLAWQLMRWIGVLLGAGTVWLAAQIGRTLAPGDERLSLLAAALLAFSPQFLHITASLNNDVPTAFLGAAILWLSITAVSPSRSGHHRYALLGLLVGLGVLSKFALLAFWPLAVLAVFPAQVRALRHLGQRDRPLPDRLRVLLPDWPQWCVWAPDLLLVLGLPLLVAGWWYGRNWMLYGDPLMWQVTLTAKGPVIAREGPFTLTDFAEFLVTHFQSYWAWFGWLTVKAPPWVYGLIMTGLLLALAGWVRWLWRRKTAVNGVALLFCVLAVTAVYTALLQYFQTVNWTGYQGRLAFVAAAPIAVLLAFGLRRWRGADIVAGSGLLALAILAVPLLLLPAFPRPEIYQPSPELTRTCMRFESGLQVEAVDAPEAVRPGETLPVTVWGYGVQPAERPRPLVVQVRGRDGALVGEARTSLAWVAGEVVSTTIPVMVDEALPARGVIAVGMQSSNSWQEATSANGRPLAVPLGVETVKIAPKRPFIPDPQVETAVAFTGQIALIGYEVTADGLILYWQALADMRHDYTTFIHVIDPATGELLAQADSQPQNGGYPTGVWDAGEIVADFKPMDWRSLDETAEVMVGVYLLETGERLPLADGDGDTVRLFTVGERP